jgi:predicted DNA-binding transcriptional regulator AlpA
MDTPKQQDLFANPSPVKSRQLKPYASSASGDALETAVNAVDCPAYNNRDVDTLPVTEVPPLDVPVQAKTTKPQKTAKEKKAQSTARIHPDMVTLHALCLLSVKQVALQYGVSPPTIWRWIKEQADFPKPVRNRGSTRWYAGDIIDHLSSLREDC